MPNSRLWLRMVRRWRWTLPLKLLTLGGKLSFLLGSQDAGDLRHYLCMYDFQLDLDFSARFSGRAYCRFVEGPTHRIRFALVQSSQLITKLLCGGFKAVSYFFDLRFLIVSQVEVA